MPLIIVIHNWMTEWVPVPPTPVEVIIDIEKAFINLLKSDLTLQNLLSKDYSGQYPVYHSFVPQKTYLPCITVETSMERGETSGLKDSFSDSKRFEWYFAVVQVDCWNNKSAYERDMLADAVLRCLLKNEVPGAIYVQEPNILTLDEPEFKPPIWRKSLRFKVMYVLEEM
jgi:hypothetical protein